MSDATTTITVAGREIQFRKRTYRDRIALQDSAHRWRKDHYADSLKLAGVEGDAFLAAMREFDRTDLPEVIDFINSGNGIIEALGMAAPDDATAEFVLEAGDGLRVVAELWGLTFTCADKPEAAPADPTPAPATA
jgi:hypothetical protein